AAEPELTGWPGWRLSAPIPAYGHGCQTNRSARGDENRPALRSGRCRSSVVRPLWELSSENTTAPTESFGPHTLLPRQPVSDDQLRVSLRLIAADGTSPYESAAQREDPAVACRMLAPPGHK